MLLSRDHSSIRFLCLVLVVALLAGLSVCAFDSAANRAVHHESAPRSTAVHSHGEAPSHDAHHDHDASGEHCCTVFSSRLGNAVPTGSTSIPVSGDAVATLPDGHVTRILPTTLVGAPRATPEQFSSRSSPPLSLRGPPLNLIG